MSFGDLLKHLRRKEDIGIKKLAPRLDISYTYLSKLENDKVIPSKDVIERIAYYFRYDLDELLISADKVPDDIRRILRENPKEAAAFLRRRFGDPSKESHP